MISILHKHSIGTVNDWDQLNTKLKVQRLIRNLLEYMDLLELETYEKNLKVER